MLVICTVVAVATRSERSGTAVQSPTPNGSDATVTESAVRRTCREWVQAVANVAASNTLSLLAGGLGALAARSL